MRCSVSSVRRGLLVDSRSAALKESISLLGNAAADARAKQYSRLIYIWHSCCSSGCSAALAPASRLPSTGAPPRIIDRSMLPIYFCSLIYSADKVCLQAQPRAGLRHVTTMLSGMTWSANNFGHDALLTMSSQLLAVIGNIGKLSVPHCNCRTHPTKPTVRSPGGGGSIVPYC